MDDRELAQRLDTIDQKLTTLLTALSSDSYDEEKDTEEKTYRADSKQTPK